MINKRREKSLQIILITTLWRFGFVVRSALVSMNVGLVDVRLTRLVLGLVTVRGFESHLRHLGI